MCCGVIAYLGNHTFRWRVTRWPRADALAVWWPRSGGRAKPALRSAATNGLATGYRPARLRRAYGPRITDHVSGSRITDHVPASAHHASAHQGPPSSLTTNNRQLTTPKCESPASSSRSSHSPRGCVLSRSSCATRSRSPKGTAARRMSSPRRSVRERRGFAPACRFHKRARSCPASSPVRATRSASAAPRKPSSTSPKASPPASKMPGRGSSISISRDWKGSGVLS